MRTFKRLITTLLLLVGAFFLYILFVLAYGTYTDYQPMQKTTLKADTKSTLTEIKDSTLTFATWNVGYGGLGHDMGFFYDAGHYFTSGDRLIRDSREAIDSNIKGALDFLKETDADFYLFQEVDVNSKRSYYINQHDLYAKEKAGFASFLSKNLDVKRIPIPIFEFWRVYGKALGGLGTYSRYQPKTSTRLQLPGSFEWPTYIFQLDRCIGEFRYDLPGEADLVVFNIHNSAYDKGGFIKKEQMKYFKSLVEREYAAGNYVIAGGDWNQCPPNYDPNTLFKDTDRTWQSNIASDLLSDDWQWVYDGAVGTNRKLFEAYNTKTTFRTVIDFFLVSPNIEVVKVKGVDQDFQYSDHQPVLMDIKLK